MARDREINEILEEKVDKFRDRAEETVGKFKERVDDARERFEDVKARGEEGWKDAMKYTQKNPAQSLGIAMLVGAALGLILFGGRRHD